MKLARHIPVQFLLARQTTVNSTHFVLGDVIYIPDEGAIHVDLACPPYRMQNINHPYNVKSLCQVVMFAQAQGYTVTVWDCTLDTNRDWFSMTTGSYIKGVANYRDLLEREMRSARLDYEFEVVRSSFSHPGLETDLLVQALRERNLCKYCQAELPKGEARICPRCLEDCPF